MIDQLLGFILLFGGGGNGGGGGGAAPSDTRLPPGGSVWKRPTPAPAPAPVFPVTPPDTLPTFPSGWCPDLPPPPEVIARATALIPTLWAQGAGAKVQEMTGGRWITYVAELIAGIQAVSAYRTENCQAVVPPVVPDVPVPPPVVPTPAVVPTPPAPVPVPVVPPPPIPIPAPVPPPPPPAPAALTPLQQAAVDMNSALQARVAMSLEPFVKRDQALYKRFQGLSGGVLTADGYPGTATVNFLRGVLQNIGVTMANVPSYPWKAAGGWNHPNAPTQAEWNA